MDPVLAFLVAHRIAILAISLGVTALVVSWQRRDRRLDAIPGPKRQYPLIGVGFFLPLNAGAHFYRWALNYGPIFKLRVGWYDYVVINTPDAVREILEKQAVSTSSKAPAPMSHGVVTGGKRMPTMEYGPRWRALRALVRNLTSAPAVATYVPSQEFEAKQLLVELATDNDNSRSFYHHMRRYALSIIFTHTFGRRIRNWDHPDARGAMKSQEILRMTSLPGAFLVDELPPLQALPTWLRPGQKRAEEANRQVLDIKMDLWRRLEKQVEAGKAPHCYAREVYENREASYSQGLDEQDLAWLVGGLVEAGFETTAVALNGLMMYLAANPEIQEKAQEELMREVGPDRLPVFADLARLPYVCACVKEVLRINPMLIPGIRHYAEADVVYKGYVIPKGTVLLANTAFLHFDPNRFENPFDFVPERFIDHQKYSAEYAAMGDPYKRDHFTFSTGRRTCPGARLAENSIDIALANILWAYEIRGPLENGVEKAVDASNSAFFPGPFHIPKPFAARFVPRSEARSRIVKEQWDIATRDGYEIRGTHVNVDGMVTE